MRKWVAKYRIPLRAMRKYISPKSDKRWKASYVIKKTPESIQTVYLEIIWKDFSHTFLWISGRRERNVRSI